MTRRARTLLLSLTTLVPVLCLSLAGGAVLLAQSQKFQAERNRLHQEAMAAQKARGVKGEYDPQLQKYPAAAIQPGTVQKVLPGGSVAIAFAGKIPAGVTILCDRDGAVLAGSALTATNFSSRITVGPSEGPGFVKLWAFTPVSFESTSIPVAFIDAVYQFDLKSANGTTIKVRPAARTFTIDDANKNARLAYQVDFYKPGEANPFETRVGTMSYTVSEDPRARLDISLTEPTGSAQAEYEELSQKVYDPKITEAQRKALAERMAKAQQRMMEEIMKPAANPAAAQKKVDDFGCRILQVYPAADGAVKGMTVCGKNFNAGRLETTGTMTLVK